MTSTSHHHPIVALFFSLNGRKIDDPRTKREIKRRPFILAQKDRRSHRETHPLRSKRMRFVAPFPRERVPLVQRESDDKILQRENYLITLPFAARARVQNNNNKRKNAGESKQQRACARSTAYLVCKSDFAPERCRCQRRGCHRVRRCCVKSEERRERERKTLVSALSQCISSPKRFFFSRTRDEGEKKEIFFFSPLD